MDRLPFSFWLQSGGLLLAMIGVFGGPIRKWLVEFFADGHAVFRSRGKRGPRISLLPFVAFVISLSVVYVIAWFSGGALLNFAATSSGSVEWRLAAIITGAVLKLVGVAALPLVATGVWVLLSTSVTRVGRGNAIAGTGLIVAFAGLVLEVSDLL